MPIFAQHRLAFVHLPRTAGRSVMRALSAACGPAEFAGTGVWDIIARSTDPAELAATIRDNFHISTLRDFPQQHVPAVALRQIAGADRWNALFRFAFVRNPWDLVVSTYHFARTDAAAGAAAGIDPDRAELLARCSTFAAFVDLYPVMRGDQCAMLCEPDGTPAVDVIGRYETLANDFAAICARAGIRATLGVENESERGDYRGYYDTRSRALVERHFARDIERFGYAF